MKKNDFCVFMDSLSPFEKGRFEDFLNSPYFSKSSKLPEMYKFLKHKNPAIDTSNNIEYFPSNEQIFKHLYPGKTFSDVIIRNLFSDLVKSGMAFLVFEGFRESKSDHSRYLLASLSKKGLNKFFKKYSGRTDHPPHGYLDYNFFLNDHYIESIRFNFNYLNEKFTKKQKANENLCHLNNSIESLVYFFILELSSKYEVAVMYDRLFDLGAANTGLKTFFESNSMEDLRNIIPANSKYFFVIELYRSLLKMTSDFENTRHYYTARNIIFRNKDHFSKDENHFFFLSFISYLIRKSGNNTTGKKFQGELFDIYKILLDKQYYMNSHTNLLTQIMYRNILFHGLKLQEFEWVAEFITKFTGELNPKIAKNMRNYASAYLAYYTKKYDESLEHLNKVKTDQFQYKYDIKNLTLMIYYEQGNIEAILYATKSYRSFVKNDRLLNNLKKKRYLKFVSYLEDLLYFNFGNKVLDLDYLYEQISANDVTAHKDWLLERIMILKGNSK
ncbi:MAG: hypothetical protein IAE90_15005 [Ignavibacteria bacterium]|nr:hypothetical protein [Ignavibacteria bacterium]